MIVILNLWCRCLFYLYEEIHHFLYNSTFVLVVCELALKIVEMN